MRVAVLGYGSQGVSSVEYWAKLGHEATVCDKNKDLSVAKADCRLGDDYLSDLDSFDLIVRSPSVHPRAIIEANPDSADILNKVTTNTNEFMKVCPSKNVIGVTGTKGKGTTCTLITKMLEESGKTVHLGGNIGTPPLEMLKLGIKPDDWVVLELANFQLIDLKYSPVLAVCLMVEPEHQDWHNGLSEYVETKQQLFRWQKPEDTAVYYSQNPLSLQIVSAGQAKKLPYFEPPGARVEGNSIVIENNKICDTAEIQLLGRHNWQNVCAAITTVWEVSKDVNALRNAVKHTKGLPFRLEFIKEVEGVAYYNDSFGTTPETAIVAIEAFTQPKVIILGGSDKGSSYKKLAEAVVVNNVRHVVAIGDTAEKILTDIKSLSANKVVGFTKLDGTPAMKTIVKTAKAEAKHGDVVLLSTGCASFGLFKDYKDRGEQFNQAVQSLV